MADDSSFWSAEVLGIIATGSAAINAVAVLVTLRYLRIQAGEARGTRKAGALKEAYDYIRQTQAARQLVYRHARQIQRVNTIRRLDMFKRSYPEAATAIHAVANCYHYAGFLLEQKLLPADAFLDEAGHTAARVYEIIAGYVECERKKLGNENYKQYFTKLGKMAVARREPQRSGDTAADDIGGPPPSTVPIYRDPWARCVVRWVAGLASAALLLTTAWAIAMLEFQNNDMVDVIIWRVPVGPLRAGVLAVWIFAPPLWFFLEYFWLYTKFGNARVFDRFTHAQHLSATVWAGVVVFLLAVFDFLRL